MRKVLTSKKFNIVWSLSAILLVWVIWLIAQACIKDDYLFPSFTESFRQFFLLFGEAFFWKALLNTLLRTVISFLISFALAFACACLGAAVKPFAAFMRPIVAVLRTLPTMAVLLLISVWLKNPAVSPVAVCFLVLFPMIYTQLYEGIEGVDVKLLEMAKVYRFSKKQVIKNIYIPQIAPAVTENTGSNLSFGIKLTVSAEVMATTYTAIGGLMSQAQLYSATPRLAALTVWSIVFGLIFEFAFVLLAKKAFKRKKAVKNEY